MPETRAGATKAVGPDEVPGREIAPIFSNRFFVTSVGSTTRIAFGEYVVGNPEVDTIYHHAVVIPTQDARALAELLARIIDSSTSLATQPNVTGNA